MDKSICIALLSGNFVGDYKNDKYALMFNYIFYYFFMTNTNTIMCFVIVASVATYLFAKKT